MLDHDPRDPANFDVSGCELVADAERSVADAVCAQSSAVHERSEHAAAVEAVEVGAWFAQSAAAAACLAERELVADECVQVGSSDDDVAAMVEIAARVSRTAASIRASVAAWPSGGEGRRPVEVAVALQSLSRDGDRFVDEHHGRLGGWGEDERLDDPDARFGRGVRRPYFVLDTRTYRDLPGQMEYDGRPGFYGPPGGDPLSHRAARVGDVAGGLDRLDRAAQLGARHCGSVNRAEILGGRCRRRTWRWSRPRTRR
jgi:hypothetical protein